MQQHLMQMQPMMASYYPSNVTTDHIQQYLDENKSLILKIVEGQNSGKLSECAENQARLQRNLMYLAAIADSQPQPPTMQGQYPSGGMMQQQQQQQGAHYMQQQAQQQMTQQQQQQQLMAARSSLLYSQQQPFSGLQQLGSGGGTSGLHMLQQNEACSNNVNIGGGSSSSGTMGGGVFPDFIRGGEGLHGVGRSLLGGSSKHDIGMGSSEGRGGNGGDGGENLYLKSSDDNAN